MVPGLYSSATAMQAAEQRHELIARNLAHVNVPGYRRQVAATSTFESALQQADQTEVPESLGVAMDSPAVDFRTGPIQRTGRPLDVALAGDGFFVVQGTEGPLYTRNGTFHLSSEGQLVTSDGLPVLSTQGPINVPPGVSPSAITITGDGKVQANGAQLGQLRLAAFADRSSLRPVGSTLFAVDAAIDPQTATDVVVQQGVLESSNVSTVDELVLMIAGLRFQEAASKAFDSIEKALEQQTQHQNA